MYAKLCFILLVLSLSARADYFNFKGDPAKNNPMDSNEGGTVVGTTLGTAKAALEHGAMKENWQTWTRFEGTSATGEKLLPPGGAMGNASKIIEGAGPVIDHAGWMSTTAGEVAEGHYTQGLFTAMNGIAKAAATGIASTVGASFGSLGGPAGTVAGGAAAGYAASSAWDASVGKLFDAIKGGLGKREDAAQIKSLASDKMGLGSNPDKVLADTHAKYLEFIQARKGQEKAEADKKIAEARAAEAAKLAADAKAAADAKKLAEAAKVAASAPPKTVSSASGQTAPPVAPVATPSPPLAVAQEPVRQMMGMKVSWGPLPAGLFCYPGQFAGNNPPPQLPNQGELELFKGAVLYCQKGGTQRRGVVAIELFVGQRSDRFPTLAEYTAKAVAQDPHNDFRFFKHVETTLGGRPGYESAGDGTVRANRFFTLNLDPDRRIVATILCEIRPGSKYPDEYEPLQRDLTAALKTFRFEVSGESSPAK